LLAGSRRRRHLDVDGLDQHKAAGRAGESGQHGGELRAETAKGDFVGGQHCQFIRHGLVRQVVGLRPLQVVLGNTLAAQIVQRVNLGLKQNGADGLDLAQLDGEWIEAARGISKALPLGGEGEAIGLAFAVLGRQRDAGLVDLALHLIDGPAESGAELLTGELARLRHGDGGAALEVLAGFLDISEQFLLLLLRKLNIIDLSGTWMGVLLVQALELGILFVELAEDLVIELPFGVEVPAGEAHERQRHEAADQEV
jgi:hypothetical protein